MKPFFIAPEYMFSVAQHEQLTQRRELELRRLGLIYDPNKIKPRDTHNPHGWEVRNKITVEDELDVKNQRNRDLIFFACQPRKGRFESVEDLTNDISKLTNSTATVNVPTTSNLRQSTRTRTRVQFASDTLSRTSSPISTTSTSPASKRRYKRKEKIQDDIDFNNNDNFNYNDTPSQSQYSTRKSTSVTSSQNEKQMEESISILKLKKEIELLINQRDANENRHKYEIENLRNHGKVSEKDIKKLENKLELIGNNTNNDYVLKYADLSTSLVKTELANHSIEVNNNFKLLKEHYENNIDYAREREEREYIERIQNQKASNKIQSDLALLTQLVQQTIVDKKDKEHKDQIAKLENMVYDKSGERMLQVIDKLTTKSSNTSDDKNTNTMLQIIESLASKSSIQPVNQLSSNDNKMQDKMLDIIERLAKKETTTSSHTLTPSIQQSMFSYPYPYPYPNHQYYPNQQYANPYNVYDNNASKLNSNSNLHSMNPTNSSSSCGNSTYHYNHQMFPFQNNFINPSSHCDVHIKPPNS